MNTNRDLTRIGVFYDGNYFFQVSNYYSYTHERKSRISIAGLHHFIRNEVAQQEGTDEKLCQIVDAHYFRGRLSAYESVQQGNNKLLYYDRMFDDILSSEGVTTHYLPIKNYNGVRVEKGIDVWLALEAFELAFYKRFDVLVLIACDGDYVPLVRKLNSIGTRVMVLSWDFEYNDHNDKKMVTRTSQDLLEEVTYPIAMHEIIDNRVKKNEPLINNLFVQGSATKTFYEKVNHNLNNRIESTILVKKEGYGFIKYSPSNLFFHFTSLENRDFNDVEVGDKVSFTIGKNDKGDDIAQNINLIE